MTDPIAAAQQNVNDLRARIQRLDGDALDLMFREARTFNAWLDKPVTDDLLRKLHELFIMGPTSGNCLPLRVIYLKTREARERLRPALGERNIEKTLAAPMTALLANDLGFWEHLPRLFPHRETASRHRDNPAFAAETAFRNATLQGAYYILAARALGLDAGPMSGFDKAKINDEFFAGTTMQINFICNLGYGDTTSLFQRLPRFAFDEITQIL